MSLILEALNKAENERNGDTAPLSYTKYSISEDDRKWHIPLATSALVIALASTALYLSPSATTTQTASPAITADDDKPKNRGIRPIEAQPQEIANQQPVSSSVSAIKKEPTPVKKDTNANANDQDRLQEIAIQKPTDNTEIEVTKKAPVTNQRNTSNSPIEHQSQISQTDRASVSIRNSTTAITPDANTQQKADPHIIEEEYLSAPIFQNLSVAIKSQLPNLELNIHVYSTNPAKSFVYINSKRYREGATIEKSITLEKVTSTGVVLRYQKTLFRLIIES